MICTQRVCLFVLFVGIGTASVGKAQGTKLLPPPSVGYVGRAVALSSEFALLAGGAGSQGTVATFRLNGGTWTDAGNLSDGTFGVSEFGSDVDVDGTTAVVGASSASASGANAGAAYIYSWNGTTWVPTQTLFAPDAQAGDRFGSQVQLGGSTMVIGAPRADAPTFDSGAVYVFNYDGAAWVFEAKLTPPGITPGAHSGSALCLDGDRVAVASPTQSTTGRADVWRRQGTYPFVTWVHEATFNSPFQPGSGFGISISLSGSTLAIGAPNADGYFSNEGAVAVFLRGGTTWSSDGILRAVDAYAGDRFGGAVTAGPDFICIGAPDKTFGITGFHGACYVSERYDGSYYQIAKLLPFDAPVGQTFGYALDSHQEKIIVGTGSNCAYVMDSQPAPTSYCTAKTNSQGCVPTIGYSGSPSLSSDTSFRVFATNIISHTSGVLFWGTLPNSAPFGGGTLCVGPTLRRTNGQNAQGDPQLINCSGSFSFYFTKNYILGQGLVPGSTVYAQFYSRDNGFAYPNSIGLTDALRFTILP